MFTVSSTLIWAVLTGPTDWVCHIGILTLCVHCVSKKVPTFKLSVTLSNLNQFSEFFHCQKAYEIATKLIRHYPRQLSYVVTVFCPLCNNGSLLRLSVCVCQSERFGRLIFATTRKSVGLKGLTGVQVRSCLCSEKNEVDIFKLFFVGMYIYNGEKYRLALHYYILICTTALNVNSCYYICYNTIIS